MFKKFNLKLRTFENLHILVQVFYMVKIYMRILYILLSGCTNSFFNAEIRKKCYNKN